MVFIVNLHLLVLVIQSWQIMNQLRPHYHTKKIKSQQCVTRVSAEYVQTSHQQQM